MIDISAPYNAAYNYFYDSIGAPKNLELFQGHMNDFSRLLPESGRVLDVACGGGHYIKALLERQKDLQITGVDVSREMVESAQARTQEYKEQARILEGDAANLRLYDNSFDGVYSVDSLKEWPDRFQCLSEMYRVTKPGGHIMLLEVDRDCTDEDAKYYIDQTNVTFMPSFLPLAYFNTFLAGVSLNIKEAQGYWEQFSFSESDVRKVPYLPYLLMYGKKS